MDDQGIPPQRQQRDRTARFGDALQHAFVEDERALPDDITRLMLDLSHIEDSPAPGTIGGERPVRQSGGLPAAARPAMPPSAGRSSRWWSPTALIGRVRRRD